MFEAKVNNVDWEMLDSIKQEGIVAKLQQAANDQDREQFEMLSSEVEKQYGAVCGFRVNKEDARSADVDNLSFLFEFTQTLLEVKSNALILVEEELRKAKDKIKGLQKQLEATDAPAAQDATPTEEAFPTGWGELASAEDCNSTQKLLVVEQGQPSGPALQLA